jgi:hypothetical protein
LVTNDIEKEKENNSNMDTNSIIVRIESNKDCLESIVAQETSLAIKNMSDPIKQLYLIFMKLMVLCFV